MILKKVTPDTYIISDWSGGKTTQIAIDPPTALYADRAFNFRLSSATVTLEESDFTPLPDYSRIIAPIEGQLSLTFNGGEAIVLNEMELCRFDGAWQTRSRGKVTDYNLMTRKGVCAGEASAITLTAGENRALPTASNPGGNRVVMLLWCVEGVVEIEAANEVVRLTAPEAVWLEDLAGDWYIRHLQGPQARLMLAEVRFN